MDGACNSSSRSKPPSILCASVGRSLDGTRPGRFYANLYDIKATPKFGMRTLAAHEGIPGHHFQIAIAMELEGMPLLRRFAPFTAYVEGWALYEIRMSSIDMTDERAEELAVLIATEGGKPLKDARVEAARAAVTLEEAAAAGMGLEGREWGMQRAAGSENKLAFTVWEPMGVVLAVSAFNHPLNLACHQAGPALAAGNTVLLKPATSTPLCSIALAEILAEAGLPEGVLQIVPAPGAAAAALQVLPQAAVGHHSLGVGQQLGQRYTTAAGISEEAVHRDRRLPQRQP